MSGAITLHNLAVALPTAVLKRAACRPETADWYWPLPGQNSSPEIEAALKLCSRCPVVRECGQWALDNRQTEGIWGGMRPGALRRLVKNRGAKEAPAAQPAKAPAHPVTGVPLKTHCPRNHELKGPRRWPCPECNKDARRRHRQRRREARLAAEVTT